MPPTLSSARRGCLGARHERLRGYLACATAGRLGATSAPPIKIVSGWERIDQSSVTLREMLQLRRCGGSAEIGEAADALGHASGCRPQAAAWNPLRLLPWPLCGLLPGRAEGVPRAARGTIAPPR